MNPSVILFSGTSVALFLVICSFYFMIRKRRSSAFIAPFFASLASLFYPYIFFGIILCVIYILISQKVTFRVLVTAVMGMLSPYLFVFSLRYILFEDIQLYLELFRSEILNFSLLKITAASVPEMLQIPLLAIVVLGSVRVVLRSIRYYKKEESSTLSRMMIILLLMVWVVVVYPVAYNSFMPFIAFPVSFLMCEYIKSIESSRSTIRGGDVLVLLIIIVVAKINLFV